MIEPDRHSKPGRLGLSVWITAVLAVSAFVFLGFRVLLGLGDEDTDPYESPLILSVARQLVAGPGELYGPFGGRNPLVLIHAPLYYRLAALGAWPVARSGIHPVIAARMAGRGLSALGLLATLATAYRLARLGGMPRRVGWWAVLLIAASPVLAGQPFTVRPDMVGIALQTIGVLLVLSAIGGESGSSARLVWGYAAFGLSACVKQHFVAAALVSTVLLLEASRRGQIRLAGVVRCLSMACGIASIVYGAEWVVTGGLIWDSAFVAARAVGRVHPGDWLHDATVIAAIVGKQAGVIGLLTAAVVSATAIRSVTGRWAIAAAIPIIAGIAGLSMAQLADAGPWVTGSLASLAMVALVVILPACAVLARPSIVGGRIELALWIYLVAELILVAILARTSTGAWINYGIQAIVLMAVLTSRALGRVLAGSASLRAMLTVGLAALGVPGAVLTDVGVDASRRRTEHAALAQVFAYARQPPSAFYFVGRPGLNRLHGRIDLVHDDWLYPVFESIRKAEPRSRWLRPILTSGTVRVLVLESDNPRVEGIAETLPALGYMSAVRIGSFLVWIR